MNLNAHQLAGGASTVPSRKDASKRVRAEVAPLVAVAVEVKCRSRGLVDVLPVDEDGYAASDRVGP